MKIPVQYLLITWQNNGNFADSIHVCVWYIDTQVAVAKLAKDV